MATKRNKPHGFSYGNNAAYLTARIKRDRPDILEDMKQGKYKSVRKAAIDAGIIYKPHPEDADLERLVGAWRAASVESRQIFLALVADDIDAPPKKRGMQPWSPAAGAEISDLEALINAGETLNSIAGKIGVSLRTVRRWRAGDTKPDDTIRTKLAEIAIVLRGDEER